MFDYTPPCATLFAENPRQADLIFFSEESAKRIATAKAMCAECAMVSECLERGMEMEFGIFGGLTPSERQSL